MKEANGNYMEIIQLNKLRSQGELFRLFAGSQMGKRYV